MYGKMQESRFTEIIPFTCASALRPSILVCVLTSSELTVWSGCSLMAARWQLFFPSWVPSGLTGSHRGAATADDCDILVYWYGKKHSISYMDKRLKGDGILHGVRLALQPHLLCAVIHSVAGGMDAPRDRCALSRCHLQSPSVPGRQGGRGCFPGLRTRFKDRTQLLQALGPWNPL